MTKQKKDKKPELDTCETKTVEQKVLSELTADVRVAAEAMERVHQKRAVEKPFHLPSYRYEILA